MTSSTTERKYPTVDQVSDSERIRMVREIFATITDKYDFLNHLLSLRQDIAWRRFAVKKMRFFQTHRFLDVGTGTCDLAIETAMRHRNVQVSGLDFVEEMVLLGKKKIERDELSPRIELLRGDALHLPSPRDSFDAAGIAFGIRNIPDKKRALQEMMRVVVPGGQVLVLEMTFPQAPFFQNLYSLYLNRILPFLARAFSPNPKAYFYLGDSIMDFPTARAFARLMESVGLVNIEMYPLTLGITYLHIGHKPKSC